MGKSMHPLRKRRAIRNRHSNNYAGPSPDASNTPNPTPHPVAPGSTLYAIPTTTAPRKYREPNFPSKLSQMRLNLAPIYPIPYGLPHAIFPPTVLHYWLLTEDEIDDFAEYYHQTRLCPERRMYPAIMNWDADFLRKPLGETTSTAPNGGIPGILTEQEHREEWERLSPEEQARLIREEQARVSRGELNAVERLAIKRRMVGKFIGLRGCDTPGWETRMHIRWTDGRIRREVEEQMQREQMAQGKGWIQ